MRTREIFVVDTLEEAYREGLFHIEEVTKDRRRFVTRVPFQLNVNGRNIIFSEGEYIKI